MTRAVGLACCVGLLAGVATVAPAAAQWSLSGYNTVRAEHYDSNPARGGPYPDLGGQFHDDAYLAATRRLSRYEHQRLDLAATLNESEYRSPERGLVLERGSFFWEKGDAALPFRAELGDFFAFQSLRTVQRGLKGAQIEVQPRGTAARRHSVQLFAGVAAPTYRGLDDDSEIVAGASWLLEDRALGALGLNLSHDYREAGRNGLPARQQTLASLAWNRELAVASERVELDTEFARFQGDHAATGVPRRNRGANGIYAQLAGRSDAVPLTYRMRFERYGEDFRPAGAAVTADHRRIEAHAGWRLAGGQQLRGRLQHFRDGLESANPVDTQVAGIGFSGAMAPGTDWGITGSVDAFVQRRDDRGGSLDLRTRSLDAALVVPLAPRLSGRVGATWTGTDDRRGAPTRVHRQLLLAVDHDFTLRPFTGTVTPGIVYRRSTGGTADRDDWSPSLALTLQSARHSLRLAYTALSQDSHVRAGTDSLTQQASLAWSYTRGRHRVGLEADWFDRDPRPGSDLVAYRLSAFWTVSFERPTSRAPRVAAAGAPPDVTHARPPDLSEIAPGMALAGVRERLAAGAIGAAVERPGLLVFESRLLQTVDRRQRLALVHDGARVERAVLAIELNGVGDPDDAARTYARVREILFRRYGTPELRIEEGEFAPDLPAALADGRFRRLLEWRTPVGRLRFGIPARTDGALRLELQHARGFAAGGRNDWGIERLR